MDKPFNQIQLPKCNRCNKRKVWKFSKKLLCRNCERADFHVPRFHYEAKHR